MLRRYIKELPVSSDTSDDDVPSSRKQFKFKSSTRAKSYPQFSHQKRRLKSLPLSSDDSSSSSSESSIVPVIKRKSLRVLSDYESGDYLQSKNITVARSSRISPPSPEIENKNTSISENDASSSEDNEISFSRRNKSQSVRALSDYDTGDSNSRGEPTLGTENYQRNLVDLNVSEENESDSDSEICFGVKRRRNHSLGCITSSESSDNEVPHTVCSLKKRKLLSSSVLSDRVCSLHNTNKRMKISVDSEESSSSSNTNSMSLNRRTRERANLRHNVDRSTSLASTSRADENSLSFNNGSRVQSRSGSDHNKNPRNKRQSPIQVQITINSSSDSSSTQSNSDSDSDEIVRSRMIRSHRQSFQSDVSSSSIESDDSFNLRFKRRGNLNTIIESEEENEDITGVEEIKENASAGSPKTEKTRLEYSSDSDGESEKCPICLIQFVLQEVATPSSCEHSFCKKCIQEWAKNSNTCPVDRKFFNSLVIRSHIGGKIIREEPVAPPTKSEEAIISIFGEIDSIMVDLGNFVEDSTSEHESEFDYDGPVEICAICRSTNDDAFIACDFCDEIFHMNCLNPPMRYVPVSEWSCPNCID